ncbi:hypothetical protein HYH03_008617 [Edaphochlamys debaryana]|uniref:Uncharacterized protein n=1 Tax=Edaphochlamys debaryana TaxID=47281 RepID=A0A836BYQ4_9CHLO|nr:hypothetical protein HYH03_008617 [Edaphochlamys debaryana]|eukprot:KAG2493197.1 hypothetical protein HYH03_008617 [Edaphochlamys debaryana]
MNARLVCKDWCQTLLAGRSHLLVHLRPVAADTDRPADASALAQARRLFPALDSLSLVLCERLPPVEMLALTTAMGAQPFFASGLRHLAFRTLSPAQGSRSSLWSSLPCFPANLTQLTSLESLTFSGRAPSTEVLSTLAPALPRLTALVVGVGVGAPQGGGGRADGAPAAAAATDAEEELDPAGCSGCPGLALPADLAPRLGLRRSALKPLCEMTSLRRLCVPLAAELDESGGHALAHAAAGTPWPLRELTALSGLTELRLAGAAVKAETVRCLLRGLPALRSLGLVIKGPGRVYDRHDLPAWRRLARCELRLVDRDLEGEAQLLALGLRSSLTALHVRNCSVTPFALSALSDLAALTELSLGAWVPKPSAAALARAGGSPSTAAVVAGEGVSAAAAALLAGPLGRRLHVLRMDLGGAGKDLYDHFPTMAAAWRHGPLRRLHVASASAYRLGASGALAALQGLGGLRELKVAVKGPACRDGSCLRAAWLPPHLTSLELAGIHLPCAQAEEEAEAGAGRGQHPQDRQGPCEQGQQEEAGVCGKDAAEAEPAPEAGAGARKPLQEVQHARAEAAGPSGRPPLAPPPLPPAGRRHRHRRAKSTAADAAPEFALAADVAEAPSGPAHRRRSVPVAALPPLQHPVGTPLGAAAAAALVTPPGQAAGPGDGPSSAAAAAANEAAGGGCGAGGSCCGHARLRRLQRLSLHSCRFGCCDHLEAALGPQALPSLTSLDLVDVAGLSDAQAVGLGALGGLTSLGVVATGPSCLHSSSLAVASGLTRLRRLRWAVGDALDTPPHPEVLKPLRRLAVLELSHGMWARLGRWGGAGGLAEALPQTELAATQ